MTLFYIDFSDELQYVSNDVGWTNLGATKHEGIEASAHYDLSNLDPRLDGLTANAGFTYTRATSEGDVAFKGRDLPLYSREVATLGLRYDINHWTHNLDVYAQSGQRAPGTGTTYITQPTADGQYGDIPGYVSVNVRSGYDFGAQLSNLKLGVGVKTCSTRNTTPAPATTTPGSTWVNRARSSCRPASASDACLIPGIDSDEGAQAPSP